MEKKYLVSLLFGLLLVMSACEDVDKSEIYQEEFHKILYLKTPGIIDMTLYKTGDDTEYDFSIVQAGAFPDLTADVQIGAMSEEELREYCEPRGLNMTRLPESCYDFSETNIHFDSEDRYKIIKLSMHTTAIDNMPTPESEYVIPIILKSENDSINSGMNILIIRPTVVIPAVTFNQTGLINQYFPEGETTIDLPLELQIDNRWNFSCEVEVDPTALGNHPLLEKGYTLENNGVVNFTEGNRTAVLRVKVNRTAAELDEVSMTVPVLPLRLKSISIPTFDIDRTPLLLGVSSKYPLTTSMLATNAQEPNEGPLPNILDGNIGTYFHSAYSITISGKHYVQVNLPEAISSFIFSYTNRSSNGNAALATFNVSVSTNGTDFTSLRDFERYTDNLPSGGAGVFNSPVMESTAPIRSVRFTCDKNCTGGVFFVWSEFSLYGF